MIRLIDAKNQLPNNYPVESFDSCQEFNPGQIAMFKRDKHTGKIVVGPSDGASFIGIIDDVRDHDAINYDSTIASGKITIWPKYSDFSFQTDQYENDVDTLIKNTSLTSSITALLFVSKNGKLTLEKEEIFCEPFCELIEYSNDYITVKML